MIDLSKLRVSDLIDRGLMNFENQFYYEFGDGEYDAVELNNGAAKFYFGSAIPDFIALIEVDNSIDEEEFALLGELFGDFPFLPGAKVEVEQIDEHFPDCSRSESSLSGEHNQHSINVWLRNGVVSGIEVSYLPRIAENRIRR